MKAELIELIPDFIPGHLRDVQVDSEAFGLSLTATIGAEGQEGTDYFRIWVCSPSWLEAELERTVIVDARHMHIVKHFDAEQIESYVRRRTAEATGPDWDAIVAKLSRWSHWEFEDYH